MAKVEFYIVRHGQTMLNMLKRSQGWSDSPLTTDGIKMAEKLHEDLDEIAFTAFYSSDLPRAVQTAKIICGHDQEVVIDPRLREWCLGIFEAENTKIFIDSLLSELPHLTRHNLDSHLDEVYETIRRLDTTGMTESFEQVCGRLEEFLRQRGNDVLHQGGGRVMVVTHAFVIKTMMHLFAREKLEDNIIISNASITKISYDGQNFTFID